MNRNKWIFAIIVVVVLSVGIASTFAMKARSNGDAGAQAKGERKILYWVDPMHPAYKSDKPGIAPDCNMDLVPVYEGQESGDNFPEGTVKINSQKQQLIGVTYGTVSAERVTHTIRTVGKVNFDETRLSRIHPRMEGWIDKVFVDFTGKEVQKGQPLLSIYSPELLASQQELLIAVRGRDYLGGSKLTEVSTNARSLYDAARERLRLFEISDEQIAEVERTRKPVRALTLHAPTSGFVLARNAFEGQKTGPEMELYQIADLSTVWVIADVYEYEAPMMSVGMPALLRLSYMPEREFRGKVSYIYPQVDPTTRTLKVRIEVPNPRMALKPEMFADVEIYMDHGKQMMVPAEAVLDSGMEQTVFVAHEGGYFEPRKVRLGAKFGDRVEVVSGLKLGETIVTSGNFLIDSESKLKSGTDGMSSAPGHEGHGAAPATGGADHSQHGAPAKGGAVDHSQHGAPAKGGVVDHSQHGAPAAKPRSKAVEDHSNHAPASKPRSKAVEDHSNHALAAAPAAHDHSNHAAPAVDHSKHKPADAGKAKPAGGHEGHEHHAPAAPAPAKQPEQDHSGHGNHSGHGPR